MKLVITESQLKRIINDAAPLSQDEIDVRLNQAKELAKDYINPRQFALAHKKLWNFLRVKGLVDVVFPKRHKYHPDGYWTPENIAKEASKYDTTSEFIKGNQVAYNRANKLGLLDTLFPIKRHDLKGPSVKFTLEKSKELAMGYDGTRTQFQKEYPAAYALLRSKNLLSYFPFKKREKQTFTDDEWKEMLKDYPTRKDLKIGNVKLYNKLTNDNLIGDFYPLDAPDSDETIIAKASEYGSLKNLRNNNQYLYVQLKRIPNGYNLAFGEDHKIKKIMDIARGYQNKYDLIKNNRYIYNKLEKLGKLDDTFKDIIHENFSLSNMKKILISESQLTNLRKRLINEYKVLPYELTYNEGSRLEYRFNVGELEYVVTLLGTEDKQVFELGFGVVGQESDAHRTGKNLEHLNTVLYTVDAIVAEAVKQHRIKKIVFAGARGETDSDLPFIDPVRMKIYFRFLTTKYPNVKYDKDRFGNIDVFMNSIYPEVFDANKDEKEMLLDVLAQLNNDPSAEDEYWRWDRTFELDHRGHVQGYTDAIINADYGGMLIEIDFDYHFTLKIELFDTGEENTETFKRFTDMISYIKERFLLN